MLKLVISIHDFNHINFLLLSNDLLLLIILSEVFNRHSVNFFSTRISYKSVFFLFVLFPKLAKHRPGCFQIKNKSNKICSFACTVMSGSQVAWCVFLQIELHFYARNVHSFTAVTIFGIPAFHWSDETIWKKTFALFKVYNIRHVIFLVKFNDNSSVRIFTKKVLNEIQFWPKI